MSDQQPLTREEREAYRLEYTGNARSYSPATQIAIIRLLDDLDRAEARARRLGQMITADLPQVKFDVLNAKLEAAERERDEANHTADAALRQLAEDSERWQAKRHGLEQTVDQWRNLAGQMTTERDQARADLARVEAEAAGMRPIVERIATRYMCCDPADPSVQFILSARAAIKGTAGRDLLAEVERLRAESLVCHSCQHHAIDCASDDADILLAVKTNKCPCWEARAALNPPAKEGAGE